MKKTILILSAIALVLILLVAGGLWYFISRLPKVKTPEAPADLETYLAEKWTMYRLRSWNEDTGELVLEYPQKLTYEQFCKYGAELDFDADALVEELVPGSRVTLLHEADNRFDARAVMVIDAEGRKLGYIPRVNNKIIARLMDAGKLIYGVIRHKEMIGDYHKIVVKVFLKE